MRHHDTPMSERWRKILFFGLMAFSALALAGLPECQAQLYYSGGFTPKRRNPPQTPASPPSDSPKAAPATPSSYFPDNDATYPSYYPGSEPRRSPSPGSPYGVLAADLPWNRADFKGYNELPALPRDTSLRQPTKYLLAATPLAPAAVSERRENALLIAHLPEHAALWVEGTRTNSMGRTRYFQSPPLLPGQNYNYRVSLAWIEEGRWVSQTRMVPVQAGLIQAIYLHAAR